MTGILETIGRLPATAATTSRDYGRGYAQAIRDVVRLLEVVPAYTEALSRVDRMLERQRGEDVDQPCNTEGCPAVADSWGLCTEHLRTLPANAFACLNCGFIGLHADWCSAGLKRAEP